MSTHTVQSAGSTPITAGVRSVYQPIVDLCSGSVVGYEALARGREGGPFERPDLLFAAARDQGLTAELDWACRAAAFEGALAAGLRAPLTLFVNVEPDAVDMPSPAGFLGTMARARRSLRAVFEVTERALANRPAELLRVVEDIRAEGWGIALDDVGADWRSLALMPFIRPDVVKLDMHLVQAPLDVKGALVGEAVRAYAASSGAHILAEGIETEAHRRRALALGATFGQGWMFGRPGPLPDLPPEELDHDPRFVVAENRPAGRAWAADSAVRGACRAQMLVLTSPSRLTTKRDLAPNRTQSRGWRVRLEGTAEGTALRETGPALACVDPSRLVTGPVEKRPSSLPEQGISGFWTERGGFEPPMD